MRAIIPALVVVALALASPLFDRSDPCHPSDGPQFKCWLLKEQR